MQHRWDSNPHRPGLLPGKELTAVRCFPKARPKNRVGIEPTLLTGFTVKLRVHEIIQCKMELEPRVALGLPTYQVGVLLLN